MKVYDLGNNGFVYEAVRRVLGVPAHVRQARVLLAAPSKAAAVRLAEAVGGIHTPNARELRVASGYDLDALQTAGLLDEPTVLVLPLDGGGREPVVRVDAEGARRIGELARPSFREPYAFHAINEEG